MKGCVIFANREKILVRTEQGVVQLLINEKSKHVKYRDEIDYEGPEVVNIINGKRLRICEPTSVTVLKINPVITDPAGLEAVDAISQATKVSEHVQENPKTKKLKATKNRFLISSAFVGQFKVGQLLEKFQRIIRISHLGKVFSYKSTNEKQSRFNDGEQVCYVYFEEAAPIFSAEDFLETTRLYFDLIKFIKTNGIKPRHKPATVVLIKKAKPYCDSRLKIEGNSWIAVNDEFVWYVTHKLSPIPLENNIKINNQLAQCWRMPIHQLSNRLESLKKIDLVLFKSNAIPDSISDETQGEVSD